MAKEFSTEEIHKALFSNLIMMLGSSAMQQMGKLVDPATNKTDLNLEGAQLTIDIIEMLKEKTKGNLGSDENKLLTDLLSSLQMNYVETARSAPKPGADAEKEPDTATDQESEPKTEEPPRPDPKDPKFHKSYGEPND